MCSCLTIYLFYFFCLLLFLYKDALFEGLTGREHLMFYGQIVGIPAPGLESFATTMLDALGILEYADQRVDHYSGGTRRKLSLGLAFLRSPNIVFLGKS